MAEQDSRVEQMFRRDCFAAWLCIAVVWAVYAFMLWRMADQFAGSGVTVLMWGLAGLVLLLNTAAVIALVKHYREDKAAIYGADIYYLDRIAAERGAAR